jgi:hypothetical protein
MEDSLINWGSPIRRPDLSSATPITVVDPPPR